MKNLITLAIFCFTTLCFAQRPSGPYLLVPTKNAQIPLKETRTEVQIAGAIAHVKTTQVYQNLGAEAIEAKYVFPLSTKAAVHKMQMRIGNRTINAKIFERQEAQKVYDTALKQGKRAAKLDQERPNVFQMAVGNIMPKDEISIDIYHTELLEPVNGQYQFVAPAVVGPRFTGESTGNEEAFAMPYTSKGISDTFNYDITVSINAGMPIQSVTSSSHTVNVSYPDLKTAEVFLSKSNENPSNRDFILNYNLRGKEIASGLLLYEHGDENFFSFQMEPMNSVSLKDIPSREYIFIVDVSGSMNGYPLDVSKELMRNLLCNLRLTDTFNVQLFASSATLFSAASMEANEQNIEAAIRFLSEGQGGGGTQLLSALTKAYKLPRNDAGSSRSMVVITDGYISVEKEAFELIRGNLNTANVFTFGIGSSVNRYLIEGMAKVSNSESFIATTKAGAQYVAEDFKTYIDSPVMSRIKMEGEGFDMYDVYPQSVPDVFAARPVTIYGKYRGKARGKIKITGYQGAEKITWEYNVSSGRLSKTNTALRYLWARKKIAELDDYKKLFNDDVKDSVIAMGIQYNLMTNYTSFVAVDETVVNKDGSLRTVKQPLPMPRNVNNSAVGAQAEVSSTSVYKKTFSIRFLDVMPTAEKRQVSLAFKALYAKLVEKSLWDNEKLRISFRKTGILSRVETLENGKWVLSNDLTKEFSEFSGQSLKLNQKMSLIIEK
ncbi:VIT and VWA domain-containing protein [Maribacter chungangensis]|uniref:VIT and VWA domain-containing protein n=1 Tax=Maribacter chungangensis TaxID=1069117 RepID=A0ABW3BA34_9FLAO